VPGPVERALLPMTAAVEPAASSRWGAAPRRPRGAVRHAPVRLRRGAPAARCAEAVEAWGDGVAYATKAFLCRAMASWRTRRGCASMSRPAASCTWRSEPAWHQSASSCTGTTSQRLSSRAPSSWRGAHHRRLLRRDRPAAGAERRGPRTPKVLVRVTRGWRHTPTSSCAPAMRTRSSGSRSPQGRRGALSRSSARSPASTSRASTPTSAARSSMSARSSRLPRSSGASSPRSVSTSCALAAASGSRT